MRYDLAAMVRRTRNPRRKSIAFRPIIAPGTLATDLFQVAFARVIREWQATIPALMAEYERSLSALTQDSAADIGAILEEREGSLFRLVLTLRLRLEQWALKVERYHRGKWRGAVLSATGVDINTLIGAGDMRDTLGAAIERNVSLIKSVSEQTRARIGDAVFRGLNQRKTAREVARDIREAVGMSRRRALNVAADQTVKITAALNDERRREAGISTWQWVHSEKANPRPEHQARNGKRYDDEAESGPHKPPADRPGELPFCGCTSRAVLRLEGEF